MKIKLLNNSIVYNVDYAAVNTIDGRLTIGINEVDNFNEMYSLLSNPDNTSTIECLSENDEITNTFFGYTNLTLFSVNTEANNMTFWLRKG